MPRASPLAAMPSMYVRFARTFKAMDDDDSQRILPVCLPVTMCQNLNPRLDFDKTRLRGRQGGPAGEEETGQGLAMSTAKTAPRHEGRYFRLHGLHS